MKLIKINIIKFKIIKTNILKIIEIIYIKKDKIIRIFNFSIEIILINILTFIALINQTIFVRIIIINLIRDRTINNKRLEHLIDIEKTVMKETNNVLCNKHHIYIKIHKLSIKEDE